jgi:cytosine/adenosine deaminase-related metal-dependent hydrolase
MDEEDVERCATHNVRICHNCSSNVRLKSGRAPLRSLLGAGIHVAIGIDEAGINDDRDMFQEMRLVLNLHRNPGIETPDITADQVMCMATRDGASTTPFSTEVGSLAPGAFADFFVIDGYAMAYPSQSDAIPLTERIVRRAREKHLQLVCIGGEEVMRDGQFTRVNETAILDDIARRMSLPLSSEEAERIAFAAAVFPHVRDFYTDYEPAVGRLLRHPALGRS